jgi:hypothetical protein
MPFGTNTGPSPSPAERGPSLWGIPPVGPSYAVGPACIGNGSNHQVHHPP